VRQWGCCFLADCYLAGLLNHQADEAFNVAASRGWIRGSDSYVNNHEGLINGLSSHFGTAKRPGQRAWLSDQSHFWVTHNGQVVYNSSKIGPQPSQQQPARQQPSSNSGGFPYLATFRECVRCRAGPSTSTTCYAQYDPGEKIWISGFVENEGRVWLTYRRNSGPMGFCCARDNDGSVYIDPFRY
jgi:hypothetical protein